MDPIDSDLFKINPYNAKGIQWLKCSKINQDFFLHLNENDHITPHYLNLLKWLQILETGPVDKNNTK